MMDSLGSVSGCLNTTQLPYTAQAPMLVPDAVASVNCTCVASDWPLTDIPVLRKTALDCCEPLWHMFRNVWV